MPPRNAGMFFAGVNTGGACSIIARRTCTVAERRDYSRPLHAVSSASTRIQRDFDPEAIRQMKAAAGRDFSVGGPDLAAQALEAALVDELHLFVTPVVVGGGKRALPHHLRLKLE